MSIRFRLNGTGVELSGVDPRRSLLDVLRGEFGVTSAKDGCAPQGQCGCCTVLVDGSARVSCVTPVRRIEGREVVTLEGLDGAVRDRWAGALADHGGSQCGFCTPGIIMRLEERRQRASAGSAARGDPGPGTGRALAAHLCRCTGWQGICDAAAEMLEGGGAPADPARVAAGGSGGPGGDGAGARASLEGGHPQRVDRQAILGAGGFAADTAPEGSLVAMLSAQGEWVVAEGTAEARALAGKVQGRRTTLEARPPVEVPPGEWTATLRTSWVEPGYLETDASWCEPGGEPADPSANGGAFGGKVASPLPAVARRLADEQGRPVLALWTREDVVRHGPKRPPVAGGMRSDGTGELRILSHATDPASRAVYEAVSRAALVAAPGLEVHPVELPGPRTSGSFRAAGWAEAFCLSVAAGADSPLGAVDGDAVSVTAPGGGGATVRVVAGAEPRIEVDVEAGDPLSQPVLRSYVTGAVHMAAGWVTSEGLAVDDEGEVQDLTIRSFGILPAPALPRVVVRSHGSGEPRPVGDPVFVATAAALWRHHGFGGDWPLRTPVL